ncbi:hypothetical protein FQ488_14695 (plasmid) [Enterococcus hirae]|uniref:hypothetical protein n=1 Tax=Enterococcus hirae TaxID=1354 RepID=UPI00162689A7|nr:hypothetical protein [Enterococcus hirae]QNG06870.1 hypothetical protein FQ488_14695 [Enterococcus hirae]
MDIKIKNVNKEEWDRFEAFCKKSNRSRSEMLKDFIRDAGKFETVLETELRMKAIIDDVIAHLDLNTQAYLLNVKKGILPMINTEEENSHEVFNQS